jgi:hypothetical protein
LVARSTLALVASDDATLLDELWALVAVDTEIDEIVERLARDGLRRLPPFGLARFDDESVRVLVRGHVVADIDGEIVSGADASTWIERHVTSIRRLALAFGPAGVEPEGVDPAQGSEQQGELFVLAGSVLAARLSRVIGVADPLGEVAVNEHWVARDAIVQMQSAALPVPMGPPPEPARPSVEAPSEWAAPIAVPNTEAAGGEPERLRQIDAEPAPATSDGSAPHSSGPTDAASESSPLQPVAAALDVDATRYPIGDDPEVMALGDVRPGNPAGPGPVAAAARLDDSVTILPGSDGTVHDRAEHASPPDGPAREAVEEVGEFDHLFGRTVARSVQSAAVRIDDDASDVGSQPDSVSIRPPIDAVPGAIRSGDTRPGAAMRQHADQLGDHDGRTVSRAALVGQRAASGAPGVDHGGPQVTALVCTRGHPNPTNRPACAVCGMSLQGAAFQQIARPTLGRLRFSDGRVIDLDRPQLIGRNPTIEGQIRGELPDIVKIDGAGQGLSRRHVSIRLEGWQVLLEDLNSANGTTITAPGRQPQRLHPGEPLVLEAGTSVDLGGEISFVLEVA